MESVLQQQNTLEVFSVLMAVGFFKMRLQMHCTLLEACKGEYVAMETFWRRLRIAGVAVGVGLSLLYIVRTAGNPSAAEIEADLLRGTTSSKTTHIAASGSAKGADTSPSSPPSPPSSSSTATTTTATPAAAPARSGNLRGSQQWQKNWAKQVARTQVQQAPPPSMWFNPRWWLTFSSL